VSSISAQRDDLADTLRSLSLRVTPQRLAVLAALHASDQHLSAEEVYENVRHKMPSVSLATVYNALGELRRVGQVRALPVSGKVRYDLAARGSHHHLVCESCQRVVDLESGDLPEPALPEAQAQGFEILTVEVIFRSICPDCRTMGTSRQAAASNQGVSVLSMQRGKR